MGLRAWWAKLRGATVEPAAPVGFNWEMVDLPATTRSTLRYNNQPSDDEPSESDAPIPLPIAYEPAPDEVVTLHDRVRFRVVRHYDSLVYQLYAGNDGEKAVAAWEKYRASALPGTFWFLDADHVSGHRGSFTSMIGESK